jgi:hypothetical protein
LPLSIPNNALLQPQFVVQFALSPVLAREKLEQSLIALRMQLISE